MSRRPDILGDVDRQPDMLALGSKSLGFFLSRNQVFIFGPRQKQYAYAPGYTLKLISLLILSP